MRKILRQSVRLFPRSLIRLTVAACLAGSPATGMAQSLGLPNNGSGITIGDLDVPGNLLTVEALVYLEKNTFGGDIVSKHLNPLNVNYLLRPLTFELTTYLSGNSGATHFLRMNNPFKLSINRWYHLAGTYDGTRVKYYVNGCLVIDSAFAGNLYQNNYTATIGNRSPCACEQFSGKIDEVRIWKTARSQQQISDNMLNLPNPASQAGLLAYYTFNGNYNNSQGNKVWNGNKMGTPVLAPGDAFVQAFEITGIQSNNADCAKTNTGNITLFSNQANAMYSLDGFHYQQANQFSALYTGNYTVYAKNPEGCIIASTVLVGNNHNLVPLNLNISLCRETSYLGYSEPGTYTDTLYAANSCDTLRTLHLARNLQSLVSVSQTICEGESYQGHYQSGIYADTLVAANGCDSIHVLNLTVTAAPQPDLGAVRSICKGDSIHLSPGNFNYYLWQDGSSNNSLIVTHPGTYSVKVGNACGSKQQQILVADGFCGLFFPTAFSPNGDGLNDEFRPQVYNLKQFHWSMFNRVGQLVFESKEYGKGWDGRLHGQLQNPGVYVWTCSYVVDHRLETKKGTLVLVR